MGVRDVPGSRSGVRPLARHRPVAGPRAERSRAVAVGKEPAGCGDGGSAGGRAAGATRRRVPQHRRRHLPAHAPLRGSGRLLRQLRQSAAGPRSRRARRVGPRVDQFLESFNNRAPLDFGEEPLEQVWTVPVRLLGDKVLRSRQSQRREPGVRPRHRRRADGHLSRARAAERRRADHLHGERRRRRRRFPRDCRSAASTRSRSVR